MKNDLSLKIIQQKAEIKLSFINAPLVAFCVLFGITPYGLQAEEQKPLWSFSGYLETYYAHDYNNPARHRRPSFVFNHHVTEQPAINLAMLKAAFQVSRLRGNLALGSGTYMRANYAAEPPGLRNIFEANLGAKLSDNHDVWLDVGVMPSHIGFESAIGIDNWTLSRSMMAESSPYFETGAKLTYTSADGKWTTSGLLLTGWQRIQRPDGNTTPSIGHQIIYKPNDKVTISSNSFIGNDKSDAQRQMRYFHDLYGQFLLDEHWSLIAAFDIGAEQAASSSGNYNVWFSPTLVVKYAYSDQWSVAGRLEHYNDKHGVIINTDSPHGFQTTGYSVNVDYQLAKFAVLRTELRKLDSRDAIFDNNGSRLSDNNFMAVTALTLRF